VDEVTFWNVTGQRVGVYYLVSYLGSLLPITLTGTPTGTEYYFGGKLIKNMNGYVHADRLGSIGKYYPYGQERPTATANGTEKFATYFRDSDTGLDYAQNRYHAPGQGRFLSVDRMQASAGPADPGTWNRYAYAGGDPVNRVDPSGQDYCELDAYLDGGVPLSCGSLISGTTIPDVCASLLPNLEAAYDCAQQVEAEEAAIQNAYLASLCGPSIESSLNGASHEDTVLRVLNENSYGLGSTNLAQEDLYIASVLQNRANSRLFNLGNGQSSASIDNQAKYAGNPNSTQYNYANVATLVAQKYNLPLDSPDCQSFLQDINTAIAAVTQVTSSGSANTSVYWWYSAGTPPNIAAGPLITTINHTSFYGQRRPRRRPR
jgi:RHS repeat-associated protein